MSLRHITRISAYGLIIQESHILLCRISNHLPIDAGYWTLPGGGIDFGEDPADAMVREVHEETGMIVRPLEVAGIDSFYVKEAEQEYHGIRIIYRTEIAGGALRYEVDGTTDLCAWWSLEDARRLPLVNLVSAGLEIAFPQDR